MSLLVGFDVTPMLGAQTGVGHSTQRLFDHLGQHRAVDLRAFALTWRGLSQLDEIVPTSVPRNRFPMPAGVLSRIWLHRNRPRVESWIGKVDVVHGTNFVVPPSAGARLVTVHDLTAIRFPEMCEPHTLKYPELVRRAVDNGAHVHTFSDFVRTEVRDLLGVDEHRIHVVPPGLDPVVPPTGEPAIDAPYILAVGTVEPRKNYGQLVRAFDLVARRHPSVELVIAGGRGWAFETLQRAISESSCSERIRYVGRVSEDDRVRLINGAQMLVYPSVYEGFGLPPLEAMQLSTPVVASSTAAAREVLGNAALLVDVTTPEPLADAIERVLVDDALQERLVADGRDCVERFKWPESTARLVALYEQLAS